MNAPTIDLNPTKSQSDLKTYRLVTLPSGLEVLIISSLDLVMSRQHNDSDGEASVAPAVKAAAAMSVQVGSYADPPDIAGILFPPDFIVIVHHSFVFVF